MTADNSKNNPIRNFFKFVINSIVWILTLLFFISALAFFTNKHYGSFVSLTILFLVLLPPLNKLLKALVNDDKVYNATKSIIFFISFGSFLYFLSTEVDEETTQPIAQIETKKEETKKVEPILEKDTLPKINQKEELNKVKQFMYEIAVRDINQAINDKKISDIKCIHDGIVSLTINPVFWSQLPYDQKKGWAIMAQRYCKDFTEDGGSLEVYDNMKNHKIAEFKYSGEFVVY